MSPLAAIGDDQYKFQISYFYKFNGWNVNNCKKISLNFSEFFAIGISIENIEKLFYRRAK